MTNFIKSLNYTTLVMFFLVIIFMYFLGFKYLENEIILTITGDEFYSPSNLSLILPQTITLFLGIFLGMNITKLIKK